MRRGPFFRGYHEGDLLRRRLVRRGVEVSAGVLAVVLTEDAVLRAAPSLALREITNRMSLLLAAGTAGQSLSAPLAALVEGVVRSMFHSKMKFVMIVVLAAQIVSAGTGFLGYRIDAKPPAAKDKKIASAPPTPTSVAVKANKHEDQTKPASPPTVAKVEQNTPDWHEKLMQSFDYGGERDVSATLSDSRRTVSQAFQYNLRHQRKSIRDGTARKTWHGRQSLIRIRFRRCAPHSQRS